MRLLCHVLHHRAPTTYGPHFLRSNPAPPPRASPLTDPLLNFQSYSHPACLALPRLAPPCPALPALQHPTPCVPRGARLCCSAPCTIARLPVYHCMARASGSHPSSPTPHRVSTLTFSIYCSHTYTHTPLSVSPVHSPSFHSLVSRAATPFPLPLSLSSPLSPHPTPFRPPTSPPPPPSSPSAPIGVLWTWPPKRGPNALLAPLAFLASRSMTSVQLLLPGPWP